MIRVIVLKSRYGDMTKLTQNGKVVSIENRHPDVWNVFRNEVIALDENAGTKVFDGCVSKFLKGNWFTVVRYLVIV